MSGTSFPCSVSVFLICVVVVASVVCAAGVQDSNPPIQNDELIKKIELYDGVYLKIPERTNDTRKLFSLEVDTGSGNSVVEGRKKQKKLMERILPMFIMPFLIQSAIIPMFLSMLKFMLFKAMMIGKVALGLVILNAFKNHNVPKGRDSEMAEVVYGYQGSDMYEYGAYIPH